MYNNNNTKIYVRQTLKRQKFSSSRRTCRRVKKTAFCFHFGEKKALKFYTFIIWKKNKLFCAFALFLTQNTKQN